MATESQEAAVRLKALMHNSDLMRAFAAPRDSWGAPRGSAMLCIRALKKHLGVNEQLRVPKERGRYREVHRGRFVVRYEDEWKGELAQVLAFLARCEAVYKERGVPLSKTIPVYISRNSGSKSAIAWYVGRMSKLNPENKAGALLFNPTHLKRADGLETCVHEVAHYVHNEMLPGGFQEPEIKAKYEAVKGDPDTGASRSERLADEFTAMRKECAKVLRAHCRRDPRVKKLGATSFKYRYPDFKVYLDEGDSQVGAYRFKARGGMSIYSAAHELKDEQLNGMIASFKTNLDSLAESLTNARQGGRDPTQYKTWRSKWIISDYGKTDEYEWFAENMTAVLLHPDDADPEVREWIMSKAKEALPTEEEAASEPARDPKSIPKFKLPVDWSFTEQGPSVVTVTDGGTQFHIVRKMDWRGQYIDEWGLKVTAKGARSARILNDYLTPGEAVKGLLRRLTLDYAPRRSERPAVTRDEMLGIVEANVDMAVDQVADYADLEEALDSYRDNVIDTLEEKGASDMYDAAMAEFSRYSNIMTPLRYTSATPPSAIRNASEMDDDKDYRLWSRQGLMWVVERSYRGRYIKDELLAGVRKKTNSSRPWIITSMTATPNAGA